MNGNNHFLQIFCSKLPIHPRHECRGFPADLIRNFKPTSIITYADRRYSDVSFYEKIGFEKLRESSPNYFYWKGSSGLKSINMFQKHKLKDKLEIFDGNKTEWENMQINGYDRIWDCGNFVFEWKQN